MISNAAFIVDSNITYPNILPYNPDANYPEYKFDNINDGKNEIYSSFRKMLVNFQLDIENFNREEWNPFKDFIKPKNTVVIKPNWVYHYNPKECDLNSLISHSSVIRVVLDYVIIALKGEGKIIIGDAPIQSCDFNTLKEKSKINEVIQYLRSKTLIPIEIKDFREEIMISNHGTYQRIPNNSSENVRVNLNQSSYLNEIRYDFLKFRVTSYDKRKMLANHNISDHIYKVARDILLSDAIIEIPKLKSHRKSGLTCCLKNNVGINTTKDCLVHHRSGSVLEGGDAYLEKNYLFKLQETFNELYDKAKNRVLQLFYKSIIKSFRLFSENNKSIFNEGSWYGNNTIWRMIHDLNKIVYYADHNGKMNETKQRNVLYIVDGIIGGEGEGPLEPNSINSGIMAIGYDPLLIDICASSLIGFDHNKIPMLDKALENKLFGYNKESLIKASINYNSRHIQIGQIKTFCNFKPASGWITHIEK